MATIPAAVSSLPCSTSLALIRLVLSSLQPLKPVVTYHSEYGTVVDYEDGCAAACNALCGSAAAAVAAAAAVSPRAAATASDGSSDSADGVPAPSGGAGAAAGR